MRVLVVGNSHVGSIKQAWDSLSAEFPETSFFFVAARGNLLRHLRFDGRHLSSADAELQRSVLFNFGCEHADLGELAPDLVLFYGVDLRLPLDFLRAIRSERFSREFLRRSLGELFTMWGWLVVRNLAPKLAADVKVSMPFLSVAGLQRTSHEEEQYRDVVEIVADFNRDYLSQFNCSYMLQPLETFDPMSGRTYQEYTQGSQRLAIGDNLDNKLHDATDVRHMNEAFGALIIRALLHTN